MVLSWVSSNSGFVFKAYFNISCWRRPDVDKKVCISEMAVSSGPWRTATAPEQSVSGLPIHLVHPKSWGQA